MAGKADIVDHVANQVEGLTKRQVADVFDSIFDSIGTTLEQGERVSISGFGSFTVAERAAREGRNPKTGEPIQIPASRNAKFKPGKELKERLN
ncbi:MAG: HU family DNA-binding protein [Acidobacteriota bacterium]